MSLEIRNRIPDSSQMQICGGCQSVVRSAYEGARVMVKPSSKTHKETGLGDSKFFFQVTIPFNVALAVAKKGIIHYQIPVDVEGLGISGKLVTVEAVEDNFGHDIVQL